MTSKDKEFISEAYALVLALEELIVKYKYEDRVMSALMVGILDVDWDSVPEEGDLVQLKSIFSYNLDSREELDMVKEIMDSQFEDGEDGLDKMLGDLGISLN